MYQIAICILIKFWQYQFPGMYMYYYISIYILEYQAALQAVVAFVVSSA